MGPLGYLGDMSEEQEQSLIDFKEYIRANNLKLNPWMNDAYLLRFCRARQFKLPKIIEMFENHLAFREKYDVDSLATKFVFPYDDELLE